MNKKLAAALLAVLLVLLGAWWYFSPFLAVRELQRAAQAGDAATLNAHVDYPALRQNLKVQLSAMLAQKLGASGASGGPMAALGGMIGQRLIEPLVEGLVRPETVMAALQSGRLVKPGTAAPASAPAAVAPPAPSDPAAAPGAPVTPVTPAVPGAPAAADPTAPAPTAPTAEEKPRWKVERDGFNRMVAYAIDPARPDEPDARRMGLVFERSGFVDWKLTDIRLPALPAR